MFFLRPKGVPILMYHYLGDAPQEDDRPYYVTESAFAEQMEFLRARGFHSITFGHMIDALSGKTPLPARSIAITFDDGHESFDKIGVPILRKNDLSAMMFVITSKLDAAGYLGAEKVRALASEGFEFGSHSHTHPILTKLDDAEIMFELRESKTRLEGVLGSEVKYFCYRGGHYNDKVKKLLREVGYSAAVCSKPGLNTSASDVLALNRMGIRGTDDIKRFARKVRGESP